MSTEHEIQELLRAHVGEVRSLRRTTYGFSSDLTALAECEQGSFFVKAMRNTAGGRRDSLLRERDVNPYVGEMAPRLRWQVADEAWVVLGFEAVEGRVAEIGPGSADLGAIVELVAAVGALELPEVARDWQETRWAAYADDPGDAELFRGDTLLHTDVNADNVLVGEGRAWLVDWAWPTRGAGFIDPACLVLQLIAAGHTAEAAESWAARCPAWGAAEPRAVDAFVRASVRMCRAFAERRPEAGWLDAMVVAAEAWAGYRGV